MKNIARFARNVVSPNRDRRLWAMEKIANYLIPDYRLTWHQMGWWEDEAFNAYLDSFGERRGLNIHRRWMLWQLLRLVSEVPGDTAECGVYEGSSSWLICSATKGSGRIHHLFDSFEGLSEPQANDGTYWTAGSLAASEAAVAQNLRPFEQSIAFHKGWIPDRFSEVGDQRFAFVHVDVDLFEPTRDSVEFFYPRLTEGGILLCDDYFFTNCPGATRAIDDFLADKPEKMIKLDAGGGFFIKDLSTAGPSDPDVPVNTATSG